MSTSKWTGADSSDWDDPDNWSPAGVPDVNSEVLIAHGAPVASASIGTVNSITDSSHLSFESAGTNSVATLLDNSGHLYVDHNGGEGGTILNIGGTLTNGGELYVGNPTLSAPDEVTAASLDNTGVASSISLTGSRANQALLDVTGSAGFGSAGVLSGHVRLRGDSAIEFSTGQIASLANFSQLLLYGRHALIEDSTALGSNSALAALASIGLGARLTLENKAAVSTTGALANEGVLDVDFNGNGGSSLTVAGALTNAENGYLDIGNLALTAPVKAKAASLDNADGASVSVVGSSDDQALLDLTAAGAGFGTAGILSGYVGVSGDAAIEFASGQISTIAAGSGLGIEGSNAFVEDRTALGSNSALAGLADVAGIMNLLDASVSTTGSVLVSGSLSLDDFSSPDGGSSVSVDGVLTNTGTVSIGQSELSLSDVVTANSFVNSGGDVNLTGNGANLATLDVSGTATNNGSISIASDTEEIAGTVGGAGYFILSTADLRFDSSVSSGQTIDETGADALILKHAQKFAGTVNGFGTGDTIDAMNFLFSGTTFNFVENSGGAGGTLTLHDGSLTAHISLNGDYSKSSFALAPDSGAGTLVKFV